MTPKEKAIELISKYLTHQDKWFLENLVDGLRMKHAKECALIAVDEIIEELETFYPKYESWDLRAKLSYYHEVKQEILNL